MTDKPTHPNDNPIQFQFILLWVAVILTLAASLFAVIEAVQSRNQISTAATNAQKGICILKLASSEHLAANEKLLTSGQATGVAKEILVGSIATEEKNVVALKDIKGCAPLP